MKVLLVGGLGYIGRHVAYRLTQEGHEVVTLDRKFPLEVDLYSNESYIYADITSDLFKSSVLGDLDKVDTIVHLAAMIDAPQSVRLPGEYYRVNFTGTANVLELAKTLKVKSFIFASSAAVYGKESVSPHKEDFPILNPENPYGGSKLFGERLIKDVCSVSGISSCSFRFFNVVGSYEKVGAIPKNKGLFSRIVDTALDLGEELHIYGDDHPTKDGFAVRDFIHVDDIAMAILMATKFLPKTAGNLTYNLGSGTGLSVKEVLDLASSSLVFNIDWKLKPMRQGEVSHSIACIDKITSETAWKPLRTDVLQALHEEYDQRIK